MITGLQYYPNFCSAEEQNALIMDLETLPWLIDLRRRVQHYGYKYNYKNRQIDSSMKLGPLPAFLDTITTKLQSCFNFKPNQTIINEYLPGQGIGTHIDCVPCFGPIIMSLSLLSACIMKFTYQNQNEEFWLEPGGLLILQDDARYKWAHTIPVRKWDEKEGIIYVRERRISLTFRTVNEEKC